MEIEVEKTPLKLPPLTPSPEKKKKKIYHDSRFAQDFKPMFNLELNKILDQQDDTEVIPVIDQDEKLAKELKDHIMTIDTMY